MNRNSRHALLHLQRARYYVKKATNQKNRLQFGVKSDAELEQVLEKLEQFSIEDKKIDEIDEQYTCPICLRTKVDDSLNTKADDSPEKRWIVSKDCDCKRPFHADCLRLIRKLRETTDQQMEHSPLLKAMHMKAADFKELIQTLMQQGELAIIKEPRAGASKVIYKLI